MSSPAPSASNSPVVAENNNDESINSNDGNNNANNDNNDNDNSNAGVQEKPQPRCRCSQPTKARFDESLPQEDPEVLRKKFDPYTIEIQEPGTAIALIDCPEPKIVIDSLNALHTYCKKADENKEVFVELKGLIPIHARMFDTNNVIQRLSMKIMSVAATVHPAKLFIAGLDIAKELLTLAQGTDDVIVEYATSVLSNLATLNTGRAQIIHHDGLPILVHLLNHGDPDIQMNSLETIWQISSDSLYIKFLTAREIVEPILTLVDSEYPPLQAVALLTLEKIAQHPDGIATLECLDLLNILSNKLSNETMVDIHRHCLKLLYHLCRDRGGCKKAAFLVPAVVELIERTPDAVARVNGMEVLGRISALEPVAKGLADSGIPYHMHALFTNPDTEQALKEACAFATAQIARSAYFSKKEFAKCLPALLELVENENTTQRGLEHSLIAISAILEDVKNSFTEFTQASGFNVMRKIFENAESYSPDVLLGALNSINIIASNPNHRSALVEVDYIPALLKLLPLSPDKWPYIHETVCNIIGNILCDPSTHAEFCKEKGPEIILKIIDSGDLSVVSAIVPIVIACSVNPESGKELTDKGLLQAIWKRTDLISKSSSLRAAFDRLISTNLPLKYAITGHISPFERLPNGFCDMGGLKIAEDLKFPKDLKWDNHDHRKKVLLLNLGHCEIDPAIVANNESLRNIDHDRGNLEEVVETVKATMESITNDVGLVEVIGKAVSNRFGGPLDKWRLTANSEDIEVADLQNKFQSVVVPISRLTTGAHRTRALVFKAICDLCEIPCSLERADYKKTWNVVLLSPEETFDEACMHPEEGRMLPIQNPAHSASLQKYVVDLVFQPGTLLPLGSFEAETYITFH